MIILAKGIVLVAAFLLSSFFSMTETVLVSLSAQNIRQLKLRWTYFAKSFEYWETHADSVLTSILICNTLVNILIGVLAASISMDISILTGVSDSWLVFINSALAATFLLMFCEIIPKVMGRLYSETLAPWACGIMVPLARFTQPSVMVLVKIAKFFMRGTPKMEAIEIPTLSALELKGMLEASSLADASQTTDARRRILKNVIEFGQLKVRDVLRSRENVVAIELRTAPRDVIRTFTEYHHFRIPVYRDHLDNIVGIIYAKDLLAAWRTEGLILIPDLLRTPYFVSEEMPIQELLREFKRGHHHFAVVRNAESRFSGIVTIEDVLEELAGPIYDENSLLD